MTPLGQGFFSLATILFNCQIRGIMQIINRPPIGVNNFEELYEALVKRQTKNDKNQCTPRNYISILTGYTVVVQCENWGLWIHSTVEGKGNNNHQERSYNICITKTEQLVTRDRKQKTNTNHNRTIS